MTEKFKITTQNTTFEHICGLAGYHASLVFTMKSDSTTTVGLSFEDTEVILNIRCASNCVSNELDAREWDQIYINDKWYGNRHGGRNGVMELYAPVLKTAAIAFG